MKRKNFIMGGAAIAVMPHLLLPKKGLHTIWNVRCFDRDGNLKWEELDIHNVLHDEGEQAILQAFFDEQYTVPANYYIGMDDRASLAEGDTLTTVNATEPSGNGYARQPVASDNVDFTIEQDGGDWQAVSKTVTFTASGGPIPAAGVVDNMFLCDVVSGTGGKLIASAGLSTSRTILVGDSLITDITTKLSE